MEKNKIYDFILLIFSWYLFCFSWFLLYPTIKNLFFVDIFPLMCLIFYEILVMISDIRYYFSQKVNYFDIFFLFISLVTLMINYFSDDIENINLIYLKIFALVLSYSKGFLFLQILDSFRHLINMIIGITRSILTTFIIFIYFIIGFGLLFTQSKRKYKLLDSIKVSFLSVFGNLMEEDENDPFDVSVWFIIVFIGIMSTLILSNFLIAIISSK